MPDFDLSGISTGTSVEWPKRGRQKKQLPDTLVNILNNCYTNKSTASLRLPKEQERSFGLLLGRAGSELNFRIERYVVPDDDPDYIIYHFRIKSRRKQANG